VSRGERLPWEYARGPEVGSDVEITGQPRDEELPGVAATEREARTEPAAEKQLASDTEEREVRAEDPELSPGTNERITHELRDVVGAERVRVPADRPRATRGAHPQQHGAAAFLNMHRFQLVRSTAIVLTFGAVVSLATGDWWLLPLAAGVHALGTMTVTLTTIRMTTISEHPAPEVAAAMSAEGVQNPDEKFSRMVEEFRAEPEHGASEVISPGFNTRTTEASADPAEAGAQQSSAMTPTAEPSESGGSGGTPDLLIWTTAFSLLVLSIVLPATMGGGWLWLLTAAMLPLLAAWALMQVLMTRGSNAMRVRSRRALIAIALCTTMAVAAFCAVVAFAFQH
jgi:hypothetical protein